MATSLDTLGFFTHTPADMLLLWEALGQTVGPEEAALEMGVPEPLPELAFPEEPPFPVLPVSVAAFALAAALPLAA